MGAAFSKDDEGTEEEKDKEKVFDKRKIYIDDFGNFCYGDILFDPEEEKIRIMQCDEPKEEDGKEWYIINTPWMRAWLLYCHLNKDINPNPGPCRNECLLDVNEAGLAWVPKPDLIMARKEKEGDYRRISKETWDTFCEMYPGSGPAIRMEFHEDEDHKFDGLYDTSTWVIDQTDFESRSGLAKNSAKLKLFGFGSKSDSKKDGEEESVKSPLVEETSPGDVGIEMEDSTISEEKRENISEFFGRKASDGIKYEPAPSRGKEKQDDDVDKWLFEE